MKLVDHFFLVQIIFAMTSCMISASGRQVDEVDKQRHQLYTAQVATVFQGSELGNIALAAQASNKPSRKPTEVETHFFSGLHILGLNINELALISPEEAHALIERRTQSGCSKNREHRQQAQAIVLQYFDHPEIQYCRSLIQKFPAQATKLQSINDKATTRTELLERIRLLREQKRRK